MGWQSETVEAFDLVEGMLARALRDSRPGGDPQRRREALAWIWVCCPDIAHQMELPPPGQAMVGEQVQEYSRRCRAF